MRLSNHLGGLRTRWPPVVVCAVLGLAIGAAGAASTTPQYGATARVLVSPRSDSGLGQSPYSAFAKTYAELVRTPTVLEPVIQKLGLQTSAADLAIGLVLGIAFGLFAGIARENLASRSAGPVACP